MCRICDMSLDNEQALLEAIEKKIKSGTLPEHFSKFSIDYLEQKWLIETRT
jgi:hypothetical protein